MKIQFRKMETQIKLLKSGAIIHQDTSSLSILRSHDYNFAES